jgi:hypothetical protein
VRWAWPLREMYRGCRRPVQEQPQLVQDVPAENDLITLVVAHDDDTGQHEAVDSHIEDEELDMARLTPMAAYAGLADGVRADVPEMVNRYQRPVGARVKQCRQSLGASITGPLLKDNSERGKRRRVVRIVRKRHAPSSANAKPRRDNMIVGVAVTRVIMTAASPCARRTRPRVSCSSASESTTTPLRKAMYRPS